MRSSNFFRKPETALQRANEFISVGKERDALEALHDMIKDRRHKVWSKTHEQIMMKHVELCVNLRNSAFAKDALFQYKSLTQQVCVKSLESVLTHFLCLAEKKTEDAQQASIEKVEEIDDLDQADAPENLLLSVVSGAATQDRMDRAVLSPWLRFLWDSYRNCLDLLRNNAMVETLYHHIARQSFKFCARYQRRTEFRKLCDILRLHLSQIQKSQHLGHVVKLSSVDSLTIMQETRLIQLDTAIQMELWQEAYRSAEDLHGMMQLSKDKDKRMVKPTSYVNYYDKLALVFWKGGNSLFHAAALLQKFIIYKDMKKSFSEEEAADQATRVLLATLSIPDGSDSPSDLTKHLDIEEQHIANVRVLSNLLRLPIAPTRAGILKEVARLGIPDIAAAPARLLYQYFEREFAPLRLATLVDGQLKTLNEAGRVEHTQYAGALRQVIATKALKQLSVIYDTLSIERVRKIIPFFSPIELERFFVDIAKHRFVKAHIDHRESCVRFSSPENSLTGVGGINTAIDGAQGVETIRTHLEDLFIQLRDTTNILDGENRLKLAKEKLKQQAKIYGYYKDQDYERILMRRRKIENYKETTETQRQEKIQKAQQEATQREEQRRKEELARLEAEAIANEKKRRLAEQQEVDEKIRREKMKQIQQNPMYQAIMKEKGEELLKDMDPEAVLNEQRQRLDAERRDQQAKLQLQEKKFDHTVRAYHLEEMKIRKAIADEKAARLPGIFEAYEKRRIQAELDKYQKDVDDYNRLELVRIDAAAFVEKVKENNKERFAEKVQQWRDYVEEKRKQILNERHEQRKKQRREEWEKKKAMELQLMAEEENRIRRQAMSSRPDRFREPAPETKADQDVSWRTGMASRSERSEAPRPEPVRPERIRGPPPVESKADQESSWRSTRPVRSEAPRAEPVRSVRGPPAPAPESEQEGNWRTRMPARPVAPRTEPVGSVRPAPESKADQETSWRSARVTARSEAPRPEIVRPERVRPAPESRADQESSWRSARVPARPEASRPEPVRSVRGPPAPGPADQEGNWRTRPARTVAARPAPEPVRGPPAAESQADQDGDWRTVARTGPAKKKPGAK